MRLKPGEQNVAADRHNQLAARAVSQLKILLEQAERNASYGTIGVEVDVQQGRARVVRMKSTTTET